MKKRILCLSLSVLMIVASFVGCGKKDKDKLMNDLGMENSKNAVTITMYVLADSEVHAEQEARVEEAASAILSSYKIKLDLKYFTAENYYKVLEENLATMKEKNGERETEAPVYTDKNGIPKTYYPPNEEYQVDVFYFSGYEKYKDYSAKGYLADFTKELAESATTLKNGVSSVLYEGVNAVNGKYDMMPVNAAIGEYTYMLVDKALLEKEASVIGDIGTLTSDKCAGFLASVKKYYPEYVPLYSSEGVLAFDDIKFFGTDAKGFASDEFSLIAGNYDDAWSYGEKDAYPVMNTVNAASATGSLNVVDQIKRLKNYEFNGYYGTEEDADKPFAVGYVKGGLEVLEKYGDNYEIVVVDNPKLTTEALYENVMAISKNNTNLKASTRVLSELYNNKALANIIAHGIEGENYIDATPSGSSVKVIKRLDKDERYTYNININNVANPALVYPTVDDDPTRADKIHNQNSDVEPDLLLGYTLYGFNKLESMVKVNEYSKTIYTKLLEAKDQTELDTALADMDKMINSEEVKAIFADGGIYSNYMKWLTDKKIYEAK